MPRATVGFGQPETDAAAALYALLEPRLAAASVEQRLLWRCARVAPSRETLAEIRQLGAALDAEGWARVVALAERHGVENLLYTQVTAAGLAAALPEFVAQRLRARYGAVTLHARRLERRLEALLARLASAGAATIPLKGASLARRYYAGRISLRPVTDIDLLVQPAEAPYWSAAFQAEGFLPIAGRSDPMSGHALRFHEMQFRSADGLLLEAHFSLCPLPAYRRALSPADVWRRAQPTLIDGVAALALSPEDELRFLSLHFAAQHQASRLIWLVDVAELLRARGADLAWRPLVEDTIARRCAAPVAVTLVRAASLLDAPVPAWVCERLKEAALTQPERLAWVAAQTPMDDWRRFLAQTLALDTFAGRLRLLQSGVASLARRLRAKGAAKNGL